MLSILAGVFGLLWGSFLNVCIYRVIRDISVVTPRSFCPDCERPIAWYDNIPVISYVVLQGRCRGCSGSIPIRYPIVELVTGGLFAAIAWKFAISGEALKWALFASLMVVLFWTDLEHMILPDEFTWSGIVIGLVFAFFVPVHSSLLDVILASWPARARSVLASALGLVVLSLPFWAFAAVYKRLRGLDVDPLGLGDVKLLALIGVFFGFQTTVPLVMVAAIFGALAGAIQLILKGRKAWKNEMPFGSFLCATAAVFIFLQ
jgi:leader peptidase (prepilin peptidase)/N-methyltransferase